MRRAAAPVAFFVCALALAWHTSPVWLWHLRLESQLRSEGRAEWLHAETRRALPTPDEAWSTLRVGNLRARLPLGESERHRCGECALHCILRLEGGGTFAVFDAPPPESHEEILDLLAPDSGDLSVFRSVEANWKTIDGLTDRVRFRGRLPATFRFEAEGSRGLVSLLSAGGSHRFVIHAYSAHGTPTRLLGLTGVPEALIDPVLAGIAVGEETGPATGACAEQPG